LWLSIFYNYDVIPNSRQESHVSASGESKKWAISTQNKAIYS
jgi:hypothetical protein